MCSLPSVPRARTVMPPLLPDVELLLDDDELLEELELEDELLLDEPSQPAADGLLPLIWM